MHTADGDHQTYRRQRRRLALGALVAAPVLLMACGSDDDGGLQGASTTLTTPTTEAPAASPLEGTWRTATVTLADAEETLTSGGLSDWIDEFRARAPFEGETVLVLEIGEEWDLYGDAEGSSRAEIDYDASYEIDGDRVVVTHSAGTNTFRWEVVGDTLRLEHLESTMPAFEGVPEAVFQRALYMTAEFTRDP